MKPVEVSDTCYAIAVLGEGEARAALLASLAGRAQDDTNLASFTSRQLVMLCWAHARANSRTAQLEAWVGAIQLAHASQPLLAQDQRNLEVALDRFGEDTEWLHPPKEEEEEEGEAEEGA